MKLTLKVTEEILNNLGQGLLEKRAFLCGAVRTVAEINISRNNTSIYFGSDSYEFISAIARAYMSVYKDGIELERSTVSEYAYGARISPKTAKIVLNDLHIIKEEKGEVVFEEGVPEEFSQSFESLSSYMQAVFIGSGSVYIPENEEDRGYHLEMSFVSGSYCESVAENLEKYLSSFKVSERKTSYALYSKSSDVITDFLYFLKANESASEITNVFAERSMKEKASRETNCRVANMDKSFKASSKYLNAIASIEKNNGVEKLSDPLKDIIKAKKANPDATLDELASIMGISKSAVNHRLRKIIQIVEEEKNEH